MKRISKYLALFLFCFITVHSSLTSGEFENASGHCMWYGQCTKGSKAKNCYYNGTARHLTLHAALQTLSEICPYLINNTVINGVNATQTCCSPDQISALYEQTRLPRQMMQSCPSCERNFLRLFCQFTCSPDHSRFMSTTAGSCLAPAAAFFSDPSPGGAQCADDVRMAVSPQFAVGLYNSCRDVIFSSTNQPVMNVICGSDDCTPRRLLHFLGQNKMAPFPIKFNVTDQPWRGLQAFNDTTQACTGVCSCQDCHTSCGSVPPPYRPPPPWIILGIDGLEFISACLAGAFVLVFLTGVIGCSVCSRGSGGAGEGVVRQNGSLYTQYDHYTAMLSGHVTFNYPNAHASCGRVDAKSVGWLQRVGHRFEKWLARLFYRWGMLCTGWPRVTIFSSLLLCAVLILGLVRFRVTTDPVELWSAPGSQVRRERDYFNKNFKPFYRVNQLIIRNTTDQLWSRAKPPPAYNVYQQYGPVLTKTMLSKVLDIQKKVESIKVWYEPDARDIQMSDLCFQPMSDGRCAVQSVTQYFQNNRSRLETVYRNEFDQMLADYIDHLTSCVQAPTAVNDDVTGLQMSCLSDFSAPMSPFVVFGGYPEEKNQPQYLNSSALVVTFLLNNYDDEQFQEKALAWEKAFLELIRNYDAGNDTKIDLMAQRSIQDEINRESESDVTTILLSYLVMFIYISLMLGNYSSVRTVLVDAKVTLGLAGVSIVMLSVFAALGFYSYMGVPATLIIMEVIPFLVLAVGVDNMFILVQAHQKAKPVPGASLEHHIADVVSRVGPSMLLTSVSESCAFFLGALTPMPAVRVFSLYAAMAVLVDFLLQISCFVSLLYFDAVREERRRIDCVICCFPKQNSDEKTEDTDPSAVQLSLLYRFARDFYAPFILSKIVRPIVVIIFVCSTLVSFSFVNKIDIGLNQQLSMPEDSYMLSYFKAQAKYLSVGPPVYFVMKDGHDYVSTAGQNQVCGSRGCNENSVLGMVSKASWQSDHTKIASVASSWIDDYFSWVSPSSGCCRRFKNVSTNFCPSTVFDPNKTVCEACPVTINKLGRPIPEDFSRYLPWFLSDNPSTNCSKGGHAAYGSAVKLFKRANTSSVGATYFMSYHSILRDSNDFTNALKYAREMTANMSIMLSKRTNVTGKSSLEGEDGNVDPVFPYSFFYVFYDQYLTEGGQTLRQLFICTAAIFVITFLLLGLDLWSAVICVLTISMILVNLIGMMYWWNISLNAISLVNLVMSIGISVEFVSHITRAFAVSVFPSRRLRAYDALTNMGSSVFSGITLTKLGGIIVLAFSKSQLFRVFYFRMYLGIVIFGASIGLVFLPVFLSYCGPPVNKAKLLERQTQCEETPTINGDRQIVDDTAKLI